MIHRREGWLRVIWGHCLGNAGPRGLLGRVQRTWPLTMLAGRVVDSSSRWGAQGQGASLPCPRSVIYGMRAELGDAPGTLERAEWVGRNSTECCVDLLLEAQVWSPRGVAGSRDS